MLKAVFGSLLLIAALAQAQIAAGAQTPPASPSPSPTPSASAAPAPTMTPPGPPSPLPNVTPTPTAAPIPGATASPLPTPLALPPDAPPQILAVQISDPVFHSGETITGTVITSTNVAAVEIRFAGHAIRIPRTDFGVWQMSYRMPHVPFFYRKNFVAQVVAMNTAGLTTTQPLNVSVR